MRILTVFTVMLLLADSAVADVTFDDFGNLKSIVLDEGAVAIRLRPGLAETDIQDLTSQYSELNASTPPKHLAHLIWEQQVSPGVSVDSVVRRLCSDSRVATVSRIGRNQGGGEVVFTNDLLFELNPVGDTAFALNWLTSLGFEVKRPPSSHSLLLGALSDDGNCTAFNDIQAVASQLAGFKYFVPDLIQGSKLLANPNDHFWDFSQAYLHDSIQDLERAYDFRLTTDTVSIHVFDEGIEDHEDFPQPFDIKGYDWLDLDPYFDIDTCSYHGMIVTGVIYAQTNDSIGIAGYNNSNFNVHMQQIYSRSGSCPGTVERAFDFWIGYAIEDAALAGADVMNFSWARDSGDISGYIASKISEAHDAGVFIVAGTGNFQQDEYDCTGILWPASLAGC